MSEEMVAQGQQAKKESEAKDAVHKLIDSLSANHQLIIITKDMTGKEPFHVHCAGPLGDTELLSGMCLTAINTIQNQKVNQQK